MEKHSRMFESAEPPNSRLPRKITATAVLQPSGQCDMKIDVTNCNSAHQAKLTLSLTAHMCSLIFDKLGDIRA